ITLLTSRSDERVVVVAIQPTNLATARFVAAGRKYICTEDCAGRGRIAMVEPARFYQLCTPGVRGKGTNSFGLQQCHNERYSPHRIMIKKLCPQNRKPPKTTGWRSRAPAKRTGTVGDRICPSELGAPCAKTIRRTVAHGITCRTITRGPRPIAGTKTASSAFATATRKSASRSPSGTRTTPY